MKFHNYSSPPQKVKTRSSLSSVVVVAAAAGEQQQAEPTAHQIQTRRQKQLTTATNNNSVKKPTQVISRQQLLQLATEQQQKPQAKRLRLDLPEELLGDGNASQPQAGEEGDEEQELDTSATESETEMTDQNAGTMAVTVVAEDGHTTTEEMFVTHTTVDASTLLKARGIGATTDESDYGGQDDNNGLNRKREKRKLSAVSATPAGSSNASSSNNSTTSTKAKLQMVHEFPALFLGLRRNRIFLVNSLAQSFELNQRDIILTLRKIKLNEHNARLASVFGLSDWEVEILFRTSVPKIADCLRNFIVWPDDLTMKLNVPVNLRQHFNRIHLILNYLVISVRPNAIRHFSDAQLETSYCPVDQCYKLKYLIASTLDGCVSFVSRAFGIQTDDEVVLSQSGFLTKFKTNTSLIAGKNFHNFEDRLANGNGHDENDELELDQDEQQQGHNKNNRGRTRRSSRPRGGGGHRGSDDGGNGGDCFEEIVSEKISKSRTFKLKNYIESVLESFQSHLILAPTACVDRKTLELLDDVVVIVGALINLQKQEVD